MRTSSRAGVLTAFVTLVVAACSASATPPIIYVTPSPGPSSAATATATVEATESQAVPPVTTPTPKPTPTPTAVKATATPAPLFSFSLISFGLFTIAPPLKLQDYILYQKDVHPHVDSSQPEAWVVKPDGTGAKLIAKGTEVGPYSPPRFNLDTVWAMDGSPIHVMRTCTPKLSDIAPYTWLETQKATMTNKDMEFQWSPNDSKVAYTHFTGVDEICEQNGSDSMTQDLMVMNANGSGKKVLVHNFNDGWLSGWTPNGNYLLVMNGSSNWQLVNAGTGAISPLGFTATNAKLSPDGSKVAYLNGGTLYVRPTGGGTVKSMTTCDDFAWSPNGGSLAITGSKLGVVNASTGVIGWATTMATAYPSWSPSGAKIAFLKTNGTGVFTIPATGGTATAIPGSTNATRVSWQP